MPALEHPYYPIIYVRGYAMTQSEIEDAVASPYMGFNLGSTKIKQEWDRSIGMHIFESPLVRLMKDYEYHDSFLAGKAVEGPLPARSIHIYRYYDQAARQIGIDETPSIPAAAEGLGKLILKIRDQVCGDDAEARASFKVYLVAHSMGGLICRCFLQNTTVSNPEAKQLVDKVFTYGTPHNGIDTRSGWNVRLPFDPFDINNFNRDEMRQYLELPRDSDRVDSLNSAFDPARFFCLVGTDHKDYKFPHFFIGPMSDGLVKIENATVAGSPRAYVYRSHSGDFGLVNSEEGYQNLVRFLFGDTYVTGELEIDDLPLPPHVAEARGKGDQVRASYLFETTVTPRGAFNVNLTERRADDASATFRTFDELLRPTNPGHDKPRSPVLFSVFLDTKKIEIGNTMVFGITLTVRSTEYEVFPAEVPGLIGMLAQVLKDRKRYSAEVLFDEHITIRSAIKPEGWGLRYVMSDQWSESEGREIPIDPDTGIARLPLENGKGFKGSLLLDFSKWNQA